jgi:excisionase family DNA binding protein
MGAAVSPDPLTAPTLKTNKMSEELKQVADLITANTIFCTKEVLTSDEAARYLGISKSYLYKLTMQQKIPHYKPMGKMCYFNREELEQWLQSNRVATDEEISQQAQQYCAKKGNRP